MIVVNLKKKTDIESISKYKNYRKIISMKKINLNTSSSSILSATIGDVFELDGHTLILEGSGRVYLTLLNTESSQWHKDRDGRSDWSHVRNLEGYALMTRGELLEIIESGSYFIE